MHKSTASFCVFFTFLMAFTLGFLVYSPAQAQVKVDIVKDSATAPVIVRKLEELHNLMIENNRADSKQRETAVSAQTGIQQQTVDAQTMNHVKTEQEKAMLNTHKRMDGGADSLCTEGTATDGQATALEKSLKSFKENMAKNLAITIGEKGTLSENGRTDYNNRLFEETRKGLCSSKAKGGAETYCGGNDPNNGHLNIETLLSANNIKQGDETEKKLDYLQQMLFSRVFSDINAELLKQPNTEVKNIIIEQDRVISAQAVASSAFHYLKSHRTASDKAGARPWMKELMEQNGFNGQTIQQLLGENPSYEAYLDYIGRRMYMGKEWVASLIKPEDAARHVPVYLGWNNILLFEIYKMLQIVALNTGQTVARDVAIDFENLENRIRAINARQ